MGRNMSQPLSPFYYYFTFSLQFHHCYDLNSYCCVYLRTISYITWYTLYHSLCKRLWAPPAYNIQQNKINISVVYNILPKWKIKLKEFDIDVYNDSRVFIFITWKNQTVHLFIFIKLPSLNFFILTMSTSTRPSQIDGLNQPFFYSLVFSLLFWT